MYDGAMVSDDDLIPLSALQHFLYCPRQCALIHIERAWSENRFTAEGRVLHERVNQTGTESRGRLKTLRALDLVSRELGLSGKADVVEVRREAGGTRYCPVEYKRGKPKQHCADEVQLCAQALCLEEMFGVDVAEGAIFYGRPRRRMPVAFDRELRHLTRSVAGATRMLLAAGITPLPEYESRKCDACSLVAQCMPKRMMDRTSIAEWISAQLRDRARIVPCDDY